LKKIYFLLLALLFTHNYIFAQCDTEDPDADGDGICDLVDICPAFDDDMDIDNDGIPYCLDSCIDVNENGICDINGDPDTITNDLKVYFSHKRGFYNGSFQLELIPNDPNAIIRYQLGNNPTLPTINSGQIYSGPITINAANNAPDLFDTDAIQTIKVIGFTSIDTTKVYSHSFLFYDPQNIAAVVISEGYNISHPLDESCVSFEFLAPHSMGLKGKQEYAGIRHNDKTTYGVRNSPKIYFRNIYGAGTFKADLFSDEYYGPTKPVEVHDQLYLRYVHQDVLNYRQKLELDLMSMAGSLSPQSKYVVYFKDGEVFGVRQLKERPDGGYMEEYVGGTKEDYDSYGAHANAAWIPPTVSVLQDYDLLFSEYYDFTNIVAFNFLNSVGGDSQNDQFRVVFPLIPNQPVGAKTYFWNWDVDFVDGIYNGIDDFTLTLNNLNSNVDFVSDYGDKLHCLCFNDGPLTEQNWMNHQNYLWSQRDVAYGLIGNYTYGGTQYTQINQNSQKPPPTLSVLETSYDQYFNGIAGQHNIYKTIPVEYNVYGGQVGAGFQLVLDNPNNFGSIYYTLDGTDPRLDGGALSPDAILYTGPVTLPKGVYKVVSRIFDSSNQDQFAKWSPMCPRYFYVDIDASYYEDLVINEIHYNPNDTIFFNPAINSLDTVSGRNLEFVEIKNNGAIPIVISNLRLTRGIDYEELAYTEIMPGEFLVYAEDLFWFEQKYGFEANGKYTGKLENSGEKILLENPFGEVIDSVRYNDNSPWPGTADKGYYSVALLNADLDNSNGINWSIQSVFTTAGAENDFTNLGIHDFSGVVFNEIHYHPFDSIDVVTGDSISSRKFEFIELHNFTNFDINLSGAFISRGVNYTFPQGAIIKANDYLVLCEDKSSFFDRYGFQAYDKYDGKLDNGGETLWLNTENGILLDAVSYDDMSPWDVNADGGTEDHSLALINPTINNDSWSNWKVQCYNTLYTPGSANQFACLSDCDDYINEINMQLIQSDNAADISIITNGTVSTGMNITYTAGTSIELLSDFHVEQGAIFHAYIASCYSP